MVSAEPVRFFAPPMSAGGVFAGRLGVYLDTSDTIDWREVAAVLEEAYRQVAPKALVAELDKST